MKMKLRILTVALCASLMLAPTGCETLKKLSDAATYTTSASTATQLIVDAEKGAQIGLDTFDTFIHLERDHRTAYAQISPKIHEFSAWLRFRIPDPTQIIPPGSDPPIYLIPRGEAILKVLRKATMTFKENRTAENEANLQTAWKTVQSAIEDCKRFTMMATGGQP